MYIIRLKPFKKGRNLRYKIIVILKGVAPHSEKIEELLGYYSKNDNVVKVDMQSVYHWLGKGAGFSNSAYKLLGSFIKL